MTDEELYYKLKPNGCWHKFPHSIKELDAVKTAGKMPCLNCNQVFFISQIVHGLNPDFNTSEGFDWLWDHIQGTELRRTFPKWYDSYRYDETEILKRKKEKNVYQMTNINPSLFKGALKEALK
jgi:hypothetical protein